MLPDLLLSSMHCATLYMRAISSQFTRLSLLKVLVKQVELTDGCLKNSDGQLKTERSIFHALKAACMGDARILCIDNYNNVEF